MTQPDLTQPQRLDLHAKTEVIPLGDDGESYIALGHVSKREFRRQLLTWNPTDEPISLQDIEHAHVRIVHGCTEHDNGALTPDDCFHYAREPGQGTQPATWFML